MITHKSKYNEENIQNAFENFKEIDSKATIKNGLKTNLNCEYWANEINYIKIGKVVFIYLIINTKTITNSSSTDDFYVEVPFTFSNDWYFPTNIKSNKNKSFYIYCQPNTNKIYLAKDDNPTKVKISEITSGYVINAQFFAFVQ